MFAIVALHYEALQHLEPLEFKTLTALLRYTDKAGRCWPSLKQLGRDVGRSEATMSRVMVRLDAAGVFAERVRREGGRYRYRINARFLPRWPGKASHHAGVQVGLHNTPDIKQTQFKHEERALTRQRFASSKGSWDGLPDLTDQWQARLRSYVSSGGKFWLPQWGDKPGQPGCLVPASVMAGLPAG